MNSAARLAAQVGSSRPAVPHPSPLKPAASRGPEMGRRGGRAEEARLRAKAEWQERRGVVMQIKSSRRI